MPMNVHSPYEDGGTPREMKPPRLTRSHGSRRLLFSVTDEPLHPCFFPVPQISVLDPANRIVKLGAVLPGQVVKKTVSIMNNSHTQLTFSLSVLFSVPELQEPKVGAQGSRRAAPSSRWYG